MICNSKVLFAYRLTFLDIEVHLPDYLVHSMSRMQLEHLALALGDITDKNLQSIKVVVHQHLIDWLVVLPQMLREVFVLVINDMADQIASLMICSPIDAYSFWGECPTCIQVAAIRVFG